MKWMPIESAPKDGTEIITVVAGFVPIVGAKWVEYQGMAKWSIDPETFMEEDHFADYFVNTTYEPTHWMPLPEPPQEKDR